MKSFDKLIAAVIALITVIFIAINVVMLKKDNSSSPLYKVEINRIETELSHGKNVSADDYDNILGICEYNDSSYFYSSDNEYVMREINGKLYRIEYNDLKNRSKSSDKIAVNLFMAGFSLFLLLLLFYIRRSIIKPFARINTLPQELAKGTLTAPLKENKSRHFGKFVWGLDMLRQKLEQSRSNDIERARKEKTFLLSLSHDIKTPLSAIKLYSKALAKGLYPSTEKQNEAAQNIGIKADEIEKLVNEMIGNLNSDFMNFDVNNSEFYLSQVIGKISDYYTDKLSVIGTEFGIDRFDDCMLSGDSDRLEEVLQNIIENAIKYGDGKTISLSFSDEEDCKLITVSNSGCTLPDAELPHIFDSFWRGSNTGSQQGSGLGLYICRRLMNGMNGDIFAEASSGTMKVTVVCRKQ